VLEACRVLCCSLRVAASRAAALASTPQGNCRGWIPTSVELSYAPQLVNIRNVGCVTQQIIQTHVALMDLSRTQAGIGVERRLAECRLVLENCDCVNPQTMQNFCSSRSTTSIARTHLCAFPMHQQAGPIESPAAGTVYLWPLWKSVSSGRRSKY
jgi:hypothetical protein